MNFSSARFICAEALYKDEEIDVSSESGFKGMLDAVGVGYRHENFYRYTSNEVVAFRFNFYDTINSCKSATELKVLLLLIGTITTAEVANLVKIVELVAE